MGRKTASSNRDMVHLVQFLAKLKNEALVRRIIRLFNEVSKAFKTQLITFIKSVIKTYKKKLNVFIKF